MTSTISTSKQCTCNKQLGTLPIDVGGIGIETLKEALGKMSEQDAMEVLKNLPQEYVKKICIEGGKQTLVQKLNQHALLIGATASVVSVIWLIATSKKK